MDHQIEMPQMLLPIERRPRQDWPWCKGFIIQGVFYSSQVTGEGYEEQDDVLDLSRNVQRTRTPLA